MSMKHVGHFSVELGKYSVINPPFTVVFPLFCRNVQTPFRFCFPFPFSNLNSFLGREKSTDNN